VYLKTANPGLGRLLKEGFEGVLVDSVVYCSSFFRRGDRKRGEGAAGVYAAPIGIKRFAPGRKDDHPDAAAHQQDRGS
jgi:hypothetical protein